MDIRDFIPDRDPDESIYVFVRPYFLSFLPWLALGAGLFIMAMLMLIVISLNFPDLVGTGLGHNILVVMGSTFLLTVLAFFTVAFIDFYYDIHIVTDRRLIDIDQHQLFRREINELALEDVQDVTSITGGVLSSLFDFGTVNIETASAMQKFEFINVRHPREIASIILDLASQAKQQQGANQAPLVPQGEVIGVINGTLYNTQESLAKTGALASPPKPETPETNDVIIETENTKEELTPPPTEDHDDNLDITIDEPPARPKKG